MSVKLQFYDAASKLLDTTIGLDLGKVRRGYDHISTIYVKNDGDEAAQNVSITSTAEDSTDADSVLASNWQTFSLNGKLILQLLIWELQKRENLPLVKILLLILLKTQVQASLNICSGAQSKILLLLF